MSDDAVPALKRHLAQQLVGRLEGWSQTDAAGLVGTDQPRISDLRRGRLDRISLEQLVRLLGRVGGSIEVQVSGARVTAFSTPWGSSVREKSKRAGRALGAGIAGGRSAGAAIGNTAMWSTVPNAARKQWQYCP